MAKLSKSNLSKSHLSKSHLSNSSIPLFVRRTHPRQEAINAAQRINEYCKRDAANSDSDESPPSIPSPPISSSTTQSDYELSHPEEKKYMYTTNVNHYLINECNAADYEDQRIQNVEKLFDYLNKNHSILIYEPKFRKSVINKMKELETHINTRIDNFNNAKYNEILYAIKDSMRANVSNSVLRAELYHHFDGINSVLAKYESWSKSKSLLAQINSMHNTLNTIKMYPFYVVSN